MAHKRENLKVFEHKMFDNRHKQMIVDFEVVDIRTAQSLWRGRGFIADSETLATAKEVALRSLCGEPAVYRSATPNRKPSWN